ncbi:MAG TPA: glycosyltransferase [bacterium]
MSARRILLMHITASSGHHRASCAVVQGLRRADPGATVVSVDAFTYTTRLVRWGIYYTYYSLIRHQPDVWEYLYDNPVVHRHIQTLRTLLHRYQARKLSALLQRVRPGVIACTQAYPCGMVADFKRQYGLDVPVVGILTDYAPHLYWFHETVDRYVVPSEEVKERFVSRGVEAGKVEVMGIPIDPRFAAPTSRAATAARLGLNPDHPTILIMGGGSGFGRLGEVIRRLDVLPHPCQLIVVAGTNRALLSWCRRQRFRHPLVAFGYTEDIHGLMDLATLLISKPGGLTTAEALARGLPMVIVNPIPGQESYNARYLLSHGVAVQAPSPSTVRQTVRDLLDRPDRLEGMRRRIAALGHPSAADDIARLLCGLHDGPGTPAASFASTREPSWT